MQHRATGSRARGCSLGQLPPRVSRPVPLMPAMKTGHGRDTSAFRAPALPETASSSRCGSARVLDARRRPRFATGPGSCRCCSGPSCQCTAFVSSGPTYVRLGAVRFGGRSPAGTTVTLCNLDAGLISRLLLNNLKAAPGWCANKDRLHTRSSKGFVWSGPRASESSPQRSNPQRPSVGPKVQRREARPRCAARRPDAQAQPLLQQPARPRRRDWPAHGASC